MDNNNEDKRLAVLIDADNISYHYIKGMMEEVAHFESKVSTELVFLENEVKRLTQASRKSTRLNSSHL